MKRILIAIVILLSVASPAAKAAIGQWNAYMAYSDITDIEPAGNMVYVLSSGSLFSYNVNDKSVSVYNKVYPLNDTDIAHIAWCGSAKRLVIIYGNQNIDLLDNNGGVTNISDYHNKSMTEDKTVNNITISGNYAYMSTGFGILKINVRDAEISDTYNLGMNVTDCAIADNSIYANTSAGIYAGNISDNLLDKNNWNKTSASVSFNDANDITVSTANGYTEYTTYDNSNKCYWSNQSDGRLQGYKLDNDNTKTVIAQDINPDGPKYNYFWYMKFANDRLYTCGGGFISGVVAYNRPGTVQVLNNDEWNIYQDRLNSITGYSYNDINSVEPDINDAQHVFASGRCGLYEFQDGKLVKYYNKDNSILEGAVDRNTVLGNDYVLVHSLLSDSNGSLWILNSQAKSQSIIELTSDGRFKSHHNGALMSGGNSLPAMVSMIKDSRGLIWFVNNNSGEPAIVGFNPQTDGISIQKNITNQDGTNVEFDFARCICEDMENNIWIGTNVGPLLLDKSQITDENPIFIQVKIPRNDGTDYADYLLSGVDISCMAIDGGNRKWFGTNGNGVYLISADNLTQVQHFTASNSPLLSNNVESIAINDASGEVFFGTDKGLCSYWSDASATNVEMTEDNVWAYPNPVNPEYTGPITVTGLSYNADVKIVTANGVLVCQGRSNGGTFVWDGCDRDGKKVASGIYMVETATREGEKGTVCKIAVIR